MQKVRARICLKNIRRNAEILKGGGKLCAVVKANAYGHGAEEIVFALGGVADCYAVALIEEGLAIRGAACGKEILVFTPPMDEEQVFMLAASGLVCTVDGRQTANLLMKVCQKYHLRARAHLKVNTGMNRYGMELGEVDGICRMLGGGLVEVTGIYSHLYSKGSAAAQQRLFLQAERICKSHYPKACAHLSATLGAVLGREYAFDMRRIGLGLYGYLPDGCPLTAEELGLKKAMKLYAQTTGKREYRFGGIGYGEPAKIEQGAPVDSFVVPQ